jgi:hypothetical protein
MDREGEKTKTTAADSDFLDGQVSEKHGEFPPPKDCSDEDVAMVTCEKQGRLADAKWEDMFARLVVFKQEHGDCLVPNRYPEDPQLGSWGKFRCGFINVSVTSCTIAN